MVEENKVPGVFSKEICESLLSQGSDPSEYLKRPTQINQIEEEEENLFFGVQKLNFSGPNFSKALDKFSPTAEVNQHFT